MDNGFNLSARSDGTVNVINIAKLLGGGGHFQSAGAVLRHREGKDFTTAVFDRDEAIHILESAIDDYIETQTV
jgi:c-di-AMP phosphodiesterase-like protein